MLLGLGLIVGWPGIAAAGEPGAVVARVYQEAITSDMLGPPKEGLALWRLRFGEELTQLWAREKRRDTLTRQIAGRLLRHFCAEQGVVVEAADIQGYLAYLRWRIEARRVRLMDELESLSDSNRGSELTDEERNRLLRSVEHLAALVSRLDQELETGETGVGRISRNDDAQHALARSEVLRWKGYKALYERFGGAVVGDARGVVPVGALEALVKERQETFGVILFDPDYLDLLDDFHFPLYGPHFPVSRRQAENYFSQPWWIRAVKEAAPKAPAGTRPERLPAAVPAG